MALAGTRPYFIRAINDWIVDNEWTPHLMVDAGWPGVAVPEAFVEDGRIVLNIRPSAVRDLVLGNDELSFSARFGGQPQWIRVPIGAVLGIYARENGEGLFFDAGDYTPPEPADEAPAEEDAGRARARPALRVVK